MFNLGERDSYPNAFRKVLYNSSLECEGLSTDHRVGQCELHEEGLEGSDRGGKRETKSSVIGQAEGPSLPLSDGIGDYYSYFSHTR